MSAIAYIFSRRAVAEYIRITNITKYNRELYEISRTDWWQHVTESTVIKKITNKTVRAVGNVQYE